MLTKLMDRTPEMFPEGTKVFFGEDDGSSKGIWKRGKVVRAPSDEDPSIGIQLARGKKYVPMFFDPCVITEAEFEVYLRDARARHVYLLDALATFPEGTWDLYWNSSLWAEHGPDSPSFDLIWLLSPKKP